MASMAIRPLVYGEDHPYGNPSSMGNRESITNLKEMTLLKCIKNLPIQRMHHLL